MSEQTPTYGAPKKSLGQNFLSDQNTARRIVAALELVPGELVLEIGPGRGALTRWLLDEEGVAVCALEKDRELAGAARARWPELGVVLGDGLSFAWEGLARSGRPVKLVGNLPYNVASPMLWEIALRATAMERGVFMVQKEVGQRLWAAPGSKAYGALSVWIQSYCAVAKCFIVGPGVFHPRPKVDSAVLRLTRREATGGFEPTRLARLLKLVFAKRRKQLKGILKECWSAEVEITLRAAGHDGTARPEMLAPTTFQALSNLCP